MHNEDLIYAFIGWGALHERASEYSSEVLHAYNFGDDGVELIHYMQIVPMGQAVSIDSIHRLAISVGPDFERMNEVSIDLKVLVGPGSCTHSLRIGAELVESVGDLTEGGNLLFVSEGEHPSLAAAMERMGRVLEELRGEPGVFGPLTDSARP
ncbi:hypothetical protein [Streptomyces goshikiensis]|uniref:hypothetical protein n=1 Tax=Streptomyces goshikiensis TaxID=1942 RepID=UPI003820097C